jgi:SPP1 gp7 family putative phage head morphogenesis protein
MPNFLKQQVLMANKGKLKIRKPRKWLYPMQAERTYTKQVQAITKIFWEKVAENAIPMLPFLVAQAKSIRGDEERIDAVWVDQLKQLMDKTYLDFSKAVSQPQVNAITAEQAQRISLLNKTQFVKVIHSSLAVNPIIQEPWLEPQMKAFQAQNTDLITKLSTDQRDRVQQTLYRNLSSGNGIERIKEDLDKDESIGKNRAKLIARDQTNKFNGQLTQLRQKEVGINSYIWTTSRDERVRPAHRALDGEVFSWSKPSPEGHPGEPIQCRCIAQPVITDAMFDE